MEFEVATLQAFHATYSEIYIHGCTFHWQEAVYKQSIQHGLSQHHKVPAFDEHIQRIYGLSFLPPEEVMQAYYCNYYCKNSPGLDNLSWV